MRLGTPGAPHLTYCTNIHAGESWAEVRASLEQHVTRVKALVSPARPFGVGLRLSGRAAGELEATGEAERLRDWLSAVGLYVFTINGFPHGAFHGVHVKEDVYRPDWLEEERLEYTDRLARLLAVLLPEGVEGSVSTVPGALRPRVASEQDVRRMSERIARHAAFLRRIFETSGRLVELALEPEPCCCFETVEETIGFFEHGVLSRSALARFADLAGLAGARAEEALRRHVGVCLDACHMAVEFEAPRAAVDALRRAGIRVGKIQISAGLRARLSGRASADRELLDALRGYADGVYLHQVVERRGVRLARYTDLPEAIEAAAASPAEPREWRVHFHVPVFRERLEPFESTQDFLRELLGIVRLEPISNHLEIETYTWEVLPPEHRREHVVDAVARELAWVAEKLAP